MATTGMTFTNGIRRARLPLSAVIATALVILSQPTPSTILYGLPIVMLGASIRTWSSGLIRKNKELAMEGPYAHTRNPLYLGSFVIGAGFVVMGNSLPVLICFVAAFVPIYWFVIRSEEEDLREKFGDVFEAYIGTVPRFFPRWTREPYGLGKFEWHLVFKHREYRTWIGLAGAVAIFAARSVWSR